jgi:hypothetical protein
MVSQRAWSVSSTIPVAAATYADGDVLGGLLTLSGALDEGFKTGQLVSGIITDTSTNFTNTKVYFFSELPSNSTFTDQAPLSIDLSDLDKIVGVMSFTAVEDLTVALFSYGSSPTTYAIPVRAETTSLYAVAVCSGAPAYTASCLSLQVQLIQDTSN